MPQKVCDGLWGSICVSQIVSSEVFGFDRNGELKRELRSESVTRSALHVGQLTWRPSTQPTEIQERGKSGAQMLQINTRPNSPRIFWQESHPADAKSQYQVNNINCRSQSGLHPRVRARIAHIHAKLRPVQDVLRGAVAVRGGKTHLIAPRPNPAGITTAYSQNAELLSQ
jgi:hypothetical protein